VCHIERRTGARKGETWQSQNAVRRDPEAVAGVISTRRISRPPSSSCAFNPRMGQEAAPPVRAQSWLRSEGQATRQLDRGFQTSTSSSRISPIAQHRPGRSVCALEALPSPVRCFRTPTAWPFNSCLPDTPISGNRRTLRLVCSLERSLAAPVRGSGHAPSKSSPAKSAPATTASCSDGHETQVAQSPHGVREDSVGSFFGDHVHRSRDEIARYAGKYGCVDDP
jgi:hypothetical protein